MATTLELTVRTASWTRPPRELVRAFEAFPVANIGDAMERLGIVDGGISPVWEGARCVGSALPVLGAAGDNAAVIEALNYIQPGDVVVINGFGHEHRALVGEQLSQRFEAAGATGAVIDGYIRDRATITEIKFPVGNRVRLALDLLRHHRGGAARRHDCIWRWRCLERGAPGIGW